jgi:serine/threonine protein kinase
VQVNPKADSIIMDNVNGFILNNLVGSSTGTSIQSHFAQYVDSCVAFISKEDAKFDLKSIMMASKGPVTDDVLLSKLTAATATSNIRKVTFSKGVDKPSSLANLLFDQQQPVPVILRGISKLFYAIHSLGTNYGFCHTDAHPHNILLDGNTGNFVLIDYGRCIFDESMLDDNFQQSIRDRILFEEMKGMEVDLFEQVCDGSANFVGKTSYSKYLLSHQDNNACRVIDLMTPRSQEISRVLHMFDIMKISYSIAVALQLRKNTPQVDKLVQVDVKMNSGKAQLVVRLPTRESLVTIIETLPPMLLPLVPGIYWFALILDYIVGHFGEQSSKFVQVAELDGQTFMYANMNNLQLADLISKSGLALALPNTIGLQSFIMQNMDEIQGYMAYMAQPLNNNSRNQAGAGSLSKRAHGGRSLMTKVEKASSNAFAKENQAYGFRAMQGGNSSNSSNSGLSSQVLSEVLGEPPLQHCPLPKNNNSNSGRQKTVNVNAIPNSNFTF